MTYGQQTEVQLLQPGDRFYFVSDPQKLTWEIVTVLIKRIIIKKPEYKDYTKNAHAGRKVVFLRNIHDSAKPCG